MQGAYENRICRVLDYIHDHPAEDLSLDRLADVAAMSRFHWHRVFRALTGETVAEAVRRVRMTRAAVWLVTTDRPLAGIAADVGYQNIASFTRTFSDHHGLPPGAYRRRGQLRHPDPPDPQGDYPVYPIEIRTLPAHRLAAIPHRGAYDKIGRAFEKASAIISGRNLWPQTRGMVGVYYDDPMSVAPEDLRSHAGVVLTEDAPLPDGFEEVTLPAGSHAVLDFTGPYSGLQQAYHHLYGDWLEGSGKEPSDTPSFELYLNSPLDTRPEDLKTEICLPLK
ncbi:GyrI-like domain-containing protein [Aestuariibius insulae]|uniref:AraC family transcriptional regulator n=1 Tax=Aestuariibius insulae TaxID=2058287 RepID=UPI00345EBEED